MKLKLLFTLSTVFGIYHVNAQDSIKPVVTLNGMSTVEVCQHEPYVDAGAVATDNSGMANLESTGTVNVNVLGTYMICYTATDASNNKSDQVCRTVKVIQCAPAGISPKLQSDFSVYPNPAKGTLFLSANTDVIEADITDLSGRIIAKRTIRNSSLDLTGIPAGIYFINVNSTDGTYRAKFILVD